MDSDTVTFALQDCIFWGIQVLGPWSRSSAWYIRGPWVRLRVGPSISREKLRQWKTLDRTFWCVVFNLSQIFKFFFQFFHSIQWYRRCQIHHTSFRIFIIMLCVFNTIFINLNFFLCHLHLHICRKPLRLVFRRIDRKDNIRYMKRKLWTTNTKILNIE